MAVQSTAESEVSTTPKQFGRRLKHLRVMSDRTITDAARELGVSPFSVSQWEAGKTTPRLPTCLQIARSYAVAPRILVTPLTEREEKALDVRLAANRKNRHGQNVFALLQTATV